MNHTVGVYDIWTNEDSLTALLLKRIRQCGTYDGYNPDWLTLSTAIDYAMKTTLKDSPGNLEKIRQALSGIGYVPLYRTSATPSIRLGGIYLSPDGTVGVNYIDATRRGIDDMAYFTDEVLDVFTTGNCNTLFTIFLKDGDGRCEFSISPDSTRLSVYFNGKIQVWNICECRMTYETALHVNKDEGIQLFWSGNGNRLMVACSDRISSIDLETENVENFQMLIGKHSRYATNEDGTVVVGVGSDGIQYFTVADPLNVLNFDDYDLSCFPYLLEYSKQRFWLLVESQCYVISQGEVELVGQYDQTVDIDPYRMSEILGDFLTLSDSEHHGDTVNCSVNRDGAVVEFLTKGGSSSTHVCKMSIDTLECEKYVKSDDLIEFRRVEKGRHPLNEIYDYEVRCPDHSGMGQLYFIRGQTEIPMGPARADAEALDVNGKIFLHRGRTIDVYDSETLGHLKSVMATDTDRWVFSGTDINGTISLIKVDDVDSTIEDGSSARISFARMKVPDFKLDVFEDCYIRVDKVWNLCFSISVRDQIVWYYNRDGNRVKPVTLNRLKLKSGKMMRSSTYKSDESKFDVDIVELDGNHIALLSMDKLEDNPNADIGATLRIIDRISGNSKHFDLHRFGNEGGKHIDISSISKVARAVKDGNEYVIAEFGSNLGSLICSREVKSGRQFPEGTGYMKGKLLACDGDLCTVRTTDNHLMCFDATLQPSDTAPEEPSEGRRRHNYSYEIPIGRTWNMSFGKIVQNNGVFFCLTDLE